MSKQQGKREPLAKKDNTKIIKLFLRPVPLYVFLFLLLIVFLSVRYINKSEVEIKKQPVEIKENLAVTNSRVIRQNDTSLIRPMLLVENPHEDQSLLPAK